MGSRGHWSGQRIELNALRSDVLVTWLEGKLQAGGVGKLVPEPEVLAAAWQRMAPLVALRGQLTHLIGNADDLPPLPPDAEQQVREHLAKDPKLAWDDALWRLCRGKPD
jgi:hypothetical protein